MKFCRLPLAALATLAMVLGPMSSLAAAPAGTTINGVRIGAKDVAALARFYQAAFGLHEVQRIQTPQMLEIMLDFGATPDAAKANTGADVVIMQREADDGKDTMAHLIFTVSDIEGVVKSIKAAGGRMEREPFQYGNTGIWIGLCIDPAGNHFELLQFPKTPARP